MSRNTSVTKRVEESISRRETLRAVGTGGLAGAGLLTTNAAATPGTVEVPELLSGETVVEYMEVPADWYQHVKHARDAKNRLADRLRTNDNVFSIALVQQPTTFGGKNGLQIRVQLQNPARTDDIPAETGDIPVTRQSAPDSHGFAGCYNSQSEKFVRGGEVVGWENNGYGTATGVVIRDPDGSQEKQVLHCAHVFWDDCDDAKSGNVTGRTAERSDSSFDGGTTDIGTVVEHNRKGDYVFIDNDNTDSDFNKSIDENDDYPDIAGCISQTKINSMASTSGETVYNMGATTGKTQGGIVASDKSFTFSCMNFHDEGVEATANFANGDSGGPTYIMRNGEAYISHVSSYRYYDRDGITTCEGNTAQRGNPVGQSAYWIQNNEDVKFGDKY